MFHPGGRMKSRQFLVLQFIILTFTLGSISCTRTSNQQPPQPPTVGPTAFEPGYSPSSTAKLKNELSIMAYNVENLFDNKVDPGTLNEMNLDWTDAQVAKKIQNLAAVITSVDAGAGPDVLLLEEVENNRILTQLNQQGLKNLYPTQVLIEGFDTRGIDVALMSKLPLIEEPTLHRIPLRPSAERPQDVPGMLKTRGILEVVLQLPNEKRLTVYVVHFPSQANPDYWREQAVAYLVELMKTHGEGEYAVAGGDFNITQEQEDRTPLFGGLLKEIGLVTHLIGCDHCQGTHNYDNDWSFLDALVFSKAFTQSRDGWQLMPDMIDVPRRGGILQMQANGHPQEYVKETGLGASDHLPIYARLRLKKH